MAHYIVSYDLHNQRTYEPVWAKLESWGATRLLESLWVVTSSKASGVLREELASAMDSDDSCAIVELKTGSEWSTRRAQKAGVDWLTRNIRNYG